MSVGVDCVSVGHRWLGYVPAGHVHNGHVVFHVDPDRNTRQERILYFVHRNVRRHMSAQTSSVDHGAVDRRGSDSASFVGYLYIIFNMLSINLIKILFKIN